MLLMKRIFIFIITSVFIIGCSNIGKKEEVTLEEKAALIIFIEEIKSSLKNGETTFLEQSLISNMGNNFLKEEIQNIDFSKINIFNSKPEFLKNKAMNVVALNIQTTTIYFDVEYVLKNKKWKINKFKERRK
ncbi:Uncharacterised protein [Fusobacterium necrogenes]|uniref:DUF4878 domain-containing protein n=2 Tax=Fusobacterium necrogenes TaxID=858 RepID=A0A377GYC9_9FUSO|nr:Uncharacterised protein [Fusobacterium necrogenes]